RIRNGQHFTVEEITAVGLRDLARDKEWIALKVAAALLGVTVRTLLNWHHRGFGPERVMLRNGKPGYSKKEVDDWIAKHGVGSRHPRSIDIANGTVLLR